MQLAQLQPQRSAPLIRAFSASKHAHSERTREQREEDEEHDQLPLATTVNHNHCKATRLEDD